MNFLIELTKRFAYHPEDKDEALFLKQLIFIVSLSCCLCGLIWGAMYYWFLGTGFTMMLPWIFVLIVGTAIPLAHFRKNHYILVYAQLTCITWIPALIQWSLGNINDSGIVMMWSFLGPIGALFFLKRRFSLYWIVQFLMIVIVSVIIEPRLTNDAQHASETYRHTFYLMNIVAPSIVVFGASFYFVSNMIKQKDLYFSLLKSLERKNKEITEIMNVLEIKNKEVTESIT